MFLAAKSYYYEGVLNFFKWVFFFIHWGGHTIYLLFFLSRYVDYIDWVLSIKLDLHFGINETNRDLLPYFYITRFDLLVFCWEFLCIYLQKMFTYNSCFLDAFAGLKNKLTIALLPFFFLFSDRIYIILLLLLS